MNRIMYFHSFGEGYLDYPKDEFIRLLDTCVAKGINVCSLEKFECRDNNAKHNLVMTIDDGYHDNLWAVRQLAKRGFSCTIFVCTGWIGKSAPKQNTNLYPGKLFLSWSDLEEIQMLGSHIASHGINHINFTRFESKLAIKELRESKQILEKNLKFDCKFFAFPNGQRGAYNSKVIELAKQAGYDYIFTTVWSRFKTLKGVNGRCEISASNKVEDVLLAFFGLRIDKYLYHRLTSRGHDWG